MSAVDRLAADYRALRDSVAAVWLDRDIVEITGPHAAAFLQGQLSQEVEGMAVGGSAWSLVLQPAGKVDALVRCTRRAPDGFILDTDAGWGEALIARLVRFKLRVAVDVQRLDWRCLALRGPAAVVPPDAETVAVGWPSLPGADLLGPAPVVPSGVAEAGLAAWEVARIEAGVPAMGAELDERTIPAEAGIVELTVSFSKGCFTGQELVARIDSRGGRVPRLLRGLRVEGAVPAPGAPVVVGAKEVGVLTSVAAHPDGHAVALGYVRREVAVPEEATIGTGGVARIDALPLVS
jgi:folate-binding protein YgfZ